jgi:hypothetical protein
MIRAICRILRRPQPPRRKPPAPNCLAHLSEAPITYRSNRDEIADLLHEPHPEKLARMRRDMNGE